MMGRSLIFLPYVDGGAQDQADVVDYRHPGPKLITGKGVSLGRGLEDADGFSALVDQLIPGDHLITSIAFGVVGVGGGEESAGLGQIGIDQFVELAS